MSRQRSMPQMSYKPGRFVLAGLLGALLALPCLLPAAVFARASGQAGAVPFSSAQRAASSSDALTKTGVSVLRLIATYGATGDQMVCTGLGVLVASQAPAAVSKNYKNWVLTDGTLVSRNKTTCGQQDTSLPLSSLEVWVSSAYTGGSTLLLGSLTCGALTNCTDGLRGNQPDDLFSGAAYTLFSFQSTVGEPEIELSPSTTASNSVVNVGLTNPKAARGAQIYPYKNVDVKNTPAANPEDYLTPAIVANPEGSSTATVGGIVTANSNAIEGGTPQINASGQLTGMWVNDSSSNGYTALPAALLLQVWQSHGLGSGSAPTVTAQNCTVATCWESGIDAYSASNFALAHADLSRASVLNPQFIAAHKYDLLAQQQLQKYQGNAPSSASSSLLAQWPLIAAGAVVLVILLLVFTMLAIRARKRRRELVAFNAEFAEAQRIVEERQRVQPQKTPLCPNCHAPVHLGDRVCPACRFPLAPSRSGLDVRLVGNPPIFSVSGQSPPPLSVTEPPLPAVPPVRKAQQIVQQPVKHLQSPIPPSAPTRNCPRCGQVVRADTIDCPACHYRLVSVVATAAQTEDIWAPMTEQRTPLQFAQSDQIGENGRESESEYAAVEGKLRNLWNRVG